MEGERLRNDFFLFSSNGRGAWREVKFGPSQTIMTGQTPRIESERDWVKIKWETKMKGPGLSKDRVGFEMVPLTLGSAPASHCILTMGCSNTIL